eukprot:NODE_4_length_3567_cov_170.286811_g3_i0.p12 GENE.NODE_4_length_3567_cov_170.286811_g3_i0~~NODE_4_length_3567_cov_170.286811_g3_i0.p12  ORF type:complete len:60 (+),score=3.59 NODE_4_length_3567_cov_170.286811_g3_i0:2492-2671(+)
MERSRKEKKIDGKGKKKQAKNPVGRKIIQTSGETKGNGHQKNDQYKEGNDDKTTMEENQ